MGFQDHFSAQADAYALHRPRYPDALFAWLASLVPDARLAWDAGTGSGQVAVGLAAVAEQVVATDASAGQLARAGHHERVTYRNEPSDRVSLPAGEVDLITAGAAAHWFELDGFYREVRRVGRTGAVVALFSYGPRDIADAVSPLLHRFQEEVLDGYWPERIEYVHTRYGTLPFPFGDEIGAPPLEMTAEWNVEDVLAFLNTWSASQRYLEERGHPPTDAIADDLARAWGDPSERRTFRYPLFVRAARL
jgi:hypothetical protein